MDPEKRLILCCSRTEMSPDVVSEAERILSGSVDWESVAQIAGRNGLLPLVAHTLTRSFPSYLSDERKRLLDGYLSRHASSNLHVTAKLIEIIEELERQGIEVLPFKGPSLALRVYGNLALRDFVDLDLLVKPKDFGRSLEILTSLGFSPPEVQVDDFNGRPRLKGRKDIMLYSPEGDFRVELHWKLSGSHFALPYEIEDLWKRMGTIEMGGRSVRALDSIDLLVYLCLHGGRHKWEKFAWVTDLNELVRKLNFEGVDWDGVRRTAAEARCERLLALGLFLIGRFYGTESGSRSLWDNGNLTVFTKIAEEVEKRDFAPNFKSTELGEWYLYHLSLKESFADRLRLHYHYFIRYGRMIVHPGEKDVATFHLPPVFFPLYYLLRPLRLFLSYVRHRWDRSERSGAGDQ